MEWRNFLTINHVHKLEPSVAGVIMIWDSHTVEVYHLVKDTITHLFFGNPFSVFAKIIGFDRLDDDTSPAIIPPVIIGFLDSIVQETMR